MHTDSGASTLIAIIFWSLESSSLKGLVLRRSLASAGMLDKCFYNMLLAHEDMRFLNLCLQYC